MNSPHRHATVLKLELSALWTAPAGGGWEREAFFARLRDDRQGAIMVIAVFMAAAVVGAVWYMFGLGEAMLYREQLRAAADAAAFDSAVEHALGMNMLSMINIVMAAWLSILVFLMVIFVTSLGLTVLSAVLLFVPVLNIAATAALPTLITFDTAMFSFIQKYQPIIFRGLQVLNGVEGTLAMAMPFAGYVVSNKTADDYRGAVATTSSFSPSMLPMRLLAGGPYANFLDAKKVLPILKTPLPKGLFGKDTSLSKITPLQRYGLPVQDDTYGMLCMHAGMELVQEGPGILRLLSNGAIRAPTILVNKIGALFGQVVGNTPWLFCSGADPVQILSTLIGGWTGDPETLSAAMGKVPILRTIAASGGSFKKFQEKYPSMFPMKPFDDSKNGSDWMQVWSSVHGSDSLTTGAATGVAISEWADGTTGSNQGGGNDDFSEAEFYFDCGAPGTENDQVVFGAALLPPKAGLTSDTSGDWQDCKYNAMWNMRWKTRLRRYHQFEFDLRKEILLSLYQGTGVESFVKDKLAPIFDRLAPISNEGSLAKVGVFDPIKACIAAFGSGTDASGGATGDFGICPVPFGSFFKFPNGGKVSVGSSSAGGYDMSQVLH